MTSRTLPFLAHGRFAGRNRNGVFGAVKGGQSPAQRTLDGIEKAFTLKGLGLDAGLASGPRARPAARTSPPSRAGVGAGESTRFGSITFPPPSKVPLETALSLPAGAQFGFGMLWTLLFTYPLMVGIQIVSARIGRVTGHGLATNIRRHYPPALLYFIVGLLVVANTINIAADVAAMGDAAKLVVGGPAHVYAVGFGVISVLLQVFIPYSRYVRVLKWLTLALLAYVGTVFVVHIPWTQFFTQSLKWPRLPWSPAYITTIVAVFGTTISPYLFFWQASQEVEDLRADPHATALKHAPRDARAGFTRIKVDTYIGMGFSNLVAFFIVLTTAVTLHTHGITDIQSSAQAATALRPIAGNFAFMLFSLGIIGTGLLAIPVLAGSAAYAMSGAFKWENSLEHEPAMAPRFYGIIVVATLVGVALVFAPIDPIKALYWSAVLNGIISVPIMAVMMLMAARSDIMGRLVVKRRLKVLGWLCTIVMAVAVIAMFVTPSA